MAYSDFVSAYEECFRFSFGAILYLYAIFDKRGSCALALAQRNIMIGMNKTVSAI